MSLGLQERAALREIFAAVAVVVTLVYLARQVRQGSTNIHNSTSWSITQALAHVNARISSDREFTDLWLRGLLELESLDEVEAERFRACAMDLLNLAVYVHAHPTPEHELFVTYLAHLAQNAPGFRAMIESVGWGMPMDLCDHPLSKSRTAVPS